MLQRFAPFAVIGSCIPALADHTRHNDNGVHQLNFFKAVADHAPRDYCIIVDRSGSMVPLRFLALS
jgi:hypothetical protein